MADTEKVANPPTELSPEAKAWWREIESTYELEPADFKLLILACRQWDRAAQARAALKKHGLTFVDGHKIVRPRPEILMERNATALFAKLVREMRLPATTAPESTSRNYGSRRPR